MLGETRRLGMHYRVSPLRPARSSWIEFLIWSDDQIKPKIVFFGEALPERFHERMDDFQHCDLLIVVGTSLSVQPFASLIDGTLALTALLFLSWLTPTFLQQLCQPLVLGF